MGLSVSLAASLLTSAASPGPAAGAPPRPPVVTPEAGQPAAPAVPARLRPADLSQGAGAARPAKAAWPAPGTASVDVATAGTGGARAGALPVWVAPAGAQSPATVRVQLLDRGALPAPWRDGMVLRVTRADGATGPGRIAVSVDYSTVAGAYGADWAGRLRLLALPECALTTPGAARCRATPLPSRQDAAGRRVSGELAATPQGSLVVLAAGPSSTTGDYAATPLQPSSSWVSGSSSGNFGWSYKLPVPPSLGGPAPDVTLGYSSSSVDGRTVSTNNQPSWLGQGFEYWPGFVERRYKPCIEDTADSPNNPLFTGDLCWGTDNAVLSLNGGSVELVRDDVTGVWRARTDTGMRVERLDDTTEPADNTVNGAWNNEYWKVTTDDGTQYFFGRNRLYGWTTDNPTTNSTWTVPVAGNHPGERCRGASFPASFCAQAWRWNLDYVVDPRGNTMSFWYANHKNWYARGFVDTDVLSYDRGGALTRIDYGTDTRTLVNSVPTDTAYTGAAAPMRVEFRTADRCVTTSCATRNGTNWPDTPTDQECAGTSCPGRYTPTFFATVRLSEVRTMVRDGTGYRDVDSWRFTHNFPPTGSGTPQALWLDSIVRTGRAGAPTIDLPEVNFDWVQKPNRVDTAGGKPSMNWHRLSAIWTETGGKIVVTYSDPQCVPGATMPATTYTNTLRCFPVVSKAGTEYFHKYVVASVTETDLTGGGTDKVTRYEYPNPPAWRYTDDDGLTRPEYRTWSDFRGYDRVRIRVGTAGEDTLTEAVFLRGMNGSRDTLTGGTRTVQVPASVGGPVADEDAFAGMARETTVYNGVTSAPVSRTVAVPWQSAATATRLIGGTTVRARFTGIQTSFTSTQLDGGRGWRTAKTSTGFDSYGKVSSVTDHGQVSPDGTSEVPGDETCTLTTYHRNLPANLLTLPGRVQTFALPCGQAATSADDVVGDVRTSYDNRPFGGTPDKGLVTQVEKLSDWTPAGGTTWTVSDRHGYDPYGREVQTWDQRGNLTTVAFTPATGPVTKVTTTNHLDWTTIEERDPARGLATSTVDINNKRTDLRHDALGRLTAVWLPNRAKATFPDDPSLTFAYLIRNSGGVNAVTSRRLNAANRYTTTYALYDGLLRARQTQAGAASGGGTVYTESTYDSAGRVSTVSTHHHRAADTPGTTLKGINAWEHKSQTLTLYDRAGRISATVVKSAGAEKWRTTTGYGGDRVYSTPPADGTPTTTIVDVRGRTVALRQHSGGSTAGPFDETTYVVNRKGQLDRIQDAAGNRWTYTYDLSGRVRTSTDPDKGLLTSTYNPAGDLLTTTDARGEVLAYEYDSFGRKTGLYDDVVAPQNKRATWTYDPSGGKGRLSSTSRWAGASRTDEYKVKIRGYTSLYAPTGEDYVIPAAETGLGGTYTVTRTYKMDGSPSTVVYPNAGGLGAETLTYTYDETTGRPEQVQTNWPGAGQYVTDTGYTEFAEVSFVEYAQAGGDWLQRAYEYDEVTRRLARDTTVRQVAPQHVADVHYTFDAAGNLTKIADTPEGGTADTQCFTVDHLRRLSAAWTPASGDCTAEPATDALGGPSPYWLSWTVNPVGNRITQTNHTAGGDVTSTSGYPAAGAARPHAATTVTTGSAVARYGYDAVGNTTCRPSPAATSNTCPSGAGSQILTWDPEDRLVSLADGSTTHTYLYDADGTRLVARDPGGTTLYLGGTEIRRTAGGAVSATRYYVRDGQAFATRTTTGGLTWLVADHQGTQAIAVAAGDQSVNRRRQTPFGTARGSSPAWQNTKGFVGGTVDPTGLTYLGARAYDPALGRFLSVDPLLDPADPQSMNNYAYADNSPVTMSDPDGRCVVEYEGGPCYKPPSAQPDPGTAPGTGCVNNSPSARSASCPGQETDTPPKEKEDPKEKKKENPKWKETLHTAAHYVGLIGTVVGLIPAAVCAPCGLIAAAVAVLEAIMLAVAGDWGAAVGALTGGVLTILFGSWGSKMAKVISERVTPVILVELGKKAFIMIDMTVGKVLNMWFVPSKLARHLNDIVHLASHTIAHFLAHLGKEEATEFCHGSTAC